jgi:hypothetical protein
VAPGSFWRLGAIFSVGAKIHLKSPSGHPVVDTETLHINILLLFVFHEMNEKTPI